MIPEPNLPWPTPFPEHAPSVSERPLRCVLHRRQNSWGTAFTRGQHEVASAVLSEQVAFNVFFSEAAFIPSGLFCKVLPEVAAIRGSKAQGLCPILPPRILGRKSAVNQLCDPGKT